jgi:hypothetical protein
VRLRRFDRCRRDVLSGADGELELELGLELEDEQEQEHDEQEPESEQEQEEEHDDVVELRGRGTGEDGSAGGRCKGGTSGNSTGNGDASAMHSAGGPRELVSIAISGRSSTGSEAVAVSPQSGRASAGTTVDGEVISSAKTLGDWRNIVLHFL